MTTTYSPRNRPAGFATFPAGVPWRYVEAPRAPLMSHVRDAHPELPVSARPWGVIATERPLTDEELYAYEIDVVS